MTSKISQLKFGTHKFKRVQWSRIKSFEKNWAPPVSPSGSPNVIIARVPNLPIASSKSPKINIPLRHQGPISRFPHQVIIPHSSPIALLRVSNFPIASLKGKGP